jgi:isoleucyl-tRNA synthetase
VVEDLSKWYVRRSRRRFWKSESDADKQSAYQTLYQVLTSLVQMLAPFMPFASEVIYRNLAGERAGWPESVHLTDWPRAESSWQNDRLRREMARVRKLVEAGLAARHAAGIRVRQPLRSITIADAPLEPELEAILLGELGVKAARYQGEGGGVSLDTEITHDLRLEGLARDLVRKLQDLRKQSGFQLDDRIAIFYHGNGILVEALERWRDYITAETLAVQVVNEAPPDGVPLHRIKIEGHELGLGVVRAGRN